ncbi:MAG: FKBP-type peptidyl-prolyl cis-trans isomerase [Rhodothermales bacterium]
MKTCPLLAIALLMLSGCGSESAESVDPDTEVSAPAIEAPAADTTDSGLAITIVTEGSGDTISPGPVAVVHYTGWLYDESAPENKGQKFDSSRDRGDPLRFPLGVGRVIQGWDEGIAGMRVGERRLLVIPPELGYGDRGAGGVIPPGATLLFDVELVGIE